MRKFLLLILAAIVIGGCGPTGDPEGQDWCYRWDFRLDDNGFNIQNGSWVYGYGLLTDNTGLLIFNYGHDAFVTANYAIVGVMRPLAVSGDIAVSASGDIFGISAAFTTTLPAAMSNYPAIFQPQELGISGNAINVTVQTSQDLYISLIEVRGNGSNPFPVNMCDNSVPLTPGTDTPTPVLTNTSTLTATSTLTRTPTPTFTPSPTSESDWTCDFDLTESIVPFGIPNFENGEPAGQWQLGLGVIPGDGIVLGSDRVRQAFIRWETTLPDLRSVKVILDYEKGSFFYAPPNAARTLFADADILDNDDLSNGTNVEITWTGSTSISNSIDVSVTTSHQHEDNPTFSGYAIIKRVIMEGNGANPCLEPTPTPTLTPTSSGPTATPTRTPVGFWTCTFNFANSDEDWIAVYNAQWGFSVDDVGAWRAKTVSPKNSLGIRYNATGTMPLRTIRIRGRTYGTRVDDPEELNFRFYNGSSWTSFTQVSYNNMLFDQTFTLTQNATRVEIYLTVTQTNVAPVEIYLVTLQGQGGTDPCSTATPTVTATGSTQTITPRAGSTGTLTPNPLITSTPRPFTRTPISIPTFGNITFAPGTPGTGTPGTGTPSTGTPSQGEQNAVGNMEGGNETSWGFGGVIGDWLGQTAQNVSNMFDAFLTTPPQAIEGLPLCMTRPLESDICAIYYILDWTLLAPDTPGALIIPMLQIILAFYSFLYFVRWVFRIIRLGASITNVGG